MRPAAVTVTGVSASAWLPADHLTAGFGDGVYVKPGAGATVTVECTPDDVFNPAVTPVAFATGVSALTGATTNVAAQLPFAVKAIRLNQTVGSSTSELKIVVRGAA